MFISDTLAPAAKAELITLLKRYSDVFAWTYDEMPGLDLSLVTHHLVTFPNSKPIRQHARKYHPDLESKITAKVEKLQRAKFIKPIQYPTKLANIVPVKK